MDINACHCMAMHGSAASRTSTRLNPMPVSSLCMEVTVTLRVLTLLRHAREAFKDWGLL